MIVGLGSDIIEIGRIRASLERFGDKFLARAFTRAEAGFCLGRSDPAAGLAARFAAKEAVAIAVRE